LVCTALPVAWSGEPAREQTLKTIEQVATAGPFQPSWDSLAKYQVPDWYQDAKFGVFIHWGVYCVPAFGNEWYPRNMYQQGSKEFQYHVKTFGPHSQFGYKDFIPKFTAEKFDPNAWADLFRKAGLKYVVPVAEHHDGFPMYDCSYTEWSAAKMGPKRDIVGELAVAVRQAGLVFGTSSHRAEHWWFYGGGEKFASDVTDPRYAGLYAPARDRKKAEDLSDPPDQAYLEDWLLRSCELVDKYQPQVVWFDWWIAQPAFHPYLRKFSAYYYNRGAQWQKGVAINYKKHGGESYPDTAGVLDIERGQLAQKRDLFWQTDTSVSKNSWGYVQNQDYKTVDSVVDDLVDIVSKNGCLLLNIGPKPDGTIPGPEQQMLLEIGQWLSVNGEAIYQSRPWKVFGEGPTQVVEGPFADTKRGAFTSQDVRFTTRGETLYAIALAWPQDGRLTIRSLATDSPLETRAIEQVELLGSAQPCQWSREAAALTVTLPPDRPAPHAFALKIRFRS
jgi:alpha-L-fucosidase